MVRRRKHRGGDNDTTPKMPVCKVNKNEVLLLAWNAPLAFEKFYLNDDRNGAMFLFEYYHVLIIFMFAFYLISIKRTIGKKTPPTYTFSKYKFETIFAAVYTGLFLIYAAHNYRIKKIVYMNCKNKSKSIGGFYDLSKKKKKIYFDNDTIQSAHDNAFKLISNDVLVFIFLLIPGAILLFNPSYI